MTTLNMASEPLRMMPSLIERLRLSPQNDPQDQRCSTEQMAALLKHKEALLREVDHRVGNSLQIVASILALSASKVESEEARLCLKNAHRHVLAVATVQQQLRTSREGGKVELAAYLRQLCDNLTASFVGDSTCIVIELRADNCTVNSSAAMNLGLIVTELVINALKHAFLINPANGRIMVTYRVQPPGWRLTVSDNGIGKQIGENNAAATGQGSAIVAELVTQLDAREEISTGYDGRSVSITHGGFSEMSAACPETDYFLARARPETDYFLARSQGPEHDHRDQMDMSVYQARWMIIPTFALFVAIALIGLLEAT